MSTATTYKNISEADQTLVGFGVIQSGDTITTAHEINHPAFEEVERESQKEVKRRKRR